MYFPELTSSPALAKKVREGVKKWKLLEREKLPGDTNLKYSKREKCFITVLGLINIAKFKFSNWENIQCPMFKLEIPSFSDIFLGRLNTPQMTCYKFGVKGAISLLIFNIFLSFTQWSDRCVCGVTSGWCLRRETLWPLSVPRW